MNTPFTGKSIVFISLFCSAHCLAQSVPEVVPDCESEVSIRQVVETLGDRVDALTIKQLAMAKETFELAQQEGRTRGWNEQQQRAVLQELLVSPDYLALEEKKAPFEQQMTAYKQAARSASTFTEAQSICRKSVALLRAIESSFAINTLEYSLAQRLIRSHP